MDKVIVIGTSGHAAEIQDYISAANRAKGNLNYARALASPSFVSSLLIARRVNMQITGFLDDDPDGYSRYQFNAPYLGTIRDHRVKEDHHYIIGIANLEFRRMIVEKFLKAGACFLTLVHPSAYISESATIGTGCILGPMVNVGPNVRVGVFNLVNSRSSLAHDTVVGDFNFIGPNVSLSGETIVGDENLFGLNSATLPGTRIGSRNKIEAGMVLDKSIADETVVFYRFKEKVIAVPKR